jgi:MoaA/NifB/PqqE/SkfB family radical SAM enzyme
MNIIKYINVFRKNKLPGQLVIQLTDRCNALCPQCGMRSTNAYARSKLATDDVRRILDHAAKNNVESVSFTGGEPLLYLDELVELIKYAGSVGIKYIRTGTNGFMFKNAHKPNFLSKVQEIAEKLSDTPLRNFWISVDSAVPSVHEKMRGFTGVIEGIAKALPVFHRCGLYPSVNLGLNRNIGGESSEKFSTRLSDNEANLVQFYHEFKTALEKFYRFVIDLGFTMVNTCYPMSFESDTKDELLNPVYGATSKAHVVHFGIFEKAMLFRALLEVIPQFRSHIRIFSPLSSLYSLYQQYCADKTMYTCRGGLDFFYIDAKDGNTYPCGFRGNENLGKYWDTNGRGAGSNGNCYRCDWECFRDPSELLGPLQEGVSSPLRLLSRVRHNSHFFRLWVNDLKYYQACDFFDSRKPLNVKRLRGFDRPPAKPNVS